MLQKLLDLKEVSDRLNVSLSTIRRWASERRLRTVKISRRVFVQEADLERLIEAHTRETFPNLAV